jgi:hypothetical protein
MSQKLFSLFVLGLLLSAGAATSSRAGEGDDLVDNPRYKFWANFKPGATSTYTQMTKYSGPEKASLPGGVEAKTITYRLVSVNKDKVVILTTVVEDDFLSTVESAATKITYPAKVKKVNLQAFMQEWNAKDGKGETIKVEGKDIKCKVKAGSNKVEGGMVEAKICYSDTVPGGVVLHTRTTKEKDMVVAETTTKLRKYSQAGTDKDGAGN